MPVVVCQADYGADDNNCITEALVFACNGYEYHKIFSSF